MKHEVEARTVPCSYPSCRKRVLQHNDQWHLWTYPNGTFRFLLGHDLPPLPGATDDDLDEEIEEYD